MSRLINQEGCPACKKSCSNILKSSLFGIHVIHYYYYYYYYYQSINQSLYFAMKHVQDSNNSKSVRLDNQAVHLRLPITKPTINTNCLPNNFRSAEQISSAQLSGLVMVEIYTECKVPNVCKVHHVTDIK